MSELVFFHKTNIINPGPQGTNPLKNIPSILLHPMPVYGHVQRTQSCIAVPTYPAVFAGRSEPMM